MKTIQYIALLIAAMLVMGLTSCTKKSGCEMVTGDYNLTGDFHYSKSGIKMRKWPGIDIEILDVHAFLVRDDSEGEFWDTIVISKSSVPLEYRKDTKIHVRASLENTASIHTMELRHDYYKLLCIEKID